MLRNCLFTARSTHHNGHWHDAEVKVHGDKLVITYEDEDA